MRLKIIANNYFLTLLKYTELSILVLKRHPENHLKQTEESLLPAIRGDFEGSQQMSIQLLRQLEQLFPQYSFAATIPTLGKVLKDDKSDPVARRLAALALDDLHSEAGDTIIKDIASNCDDKGLQTLCNALLVRTDYRMNLGGKN